MYRNVALSALLAAQVFGFANAAAADRTGAIEFRPPALPGVGYERAPARAPGPEPRPFDRRGFEFRLGGGGWFANCQRGEHEACTGASAGGGLGWRVTSAIGWGASVTYGSLGSGHATFEETFVGLSARLHPFGTGQLDPYAELSTGVSWISSTGRTGPEAGPQLMGNLGLDVYVSDRIKFGPFVGISERFGRYQGLCTIDPACIDGSAGPWHTTLRLGVNLGVDFGRKL